MALLTSEYEERLRCPFKSTILKPPSRASTVHGGGNRRIGRDYMKGAPTEADALHRLHGAGHGLIRLEPFRYFLRGQAIQRVANVPKPHPRNLVPMLSSLSNG